MEKIKLSLVSGSSLEKPLVTAFNGANASYVVLDNEMNGTMGLPIILVSKLENNKLVKITDQNEWNAVKEYLRMIIAGNQVNYISVEPALSADDVFFSQLTLPVASFEALKNNYNSNGVSNVANGATSTPTPVATPTPDVAPTALSMPTSPVTPEVTPASPSPVTPPNVDAVASEPVMPNMAGQMPSAPAAEPTTPVTPAVEPTVAPEEPTPMPNVTPVMPEPPQNAQAAAPVMPEPVAPASLVEPPMPPSAPAEENPQPEVPVDFTADKEAFLKACENMFDALVAKFNK